jgi:hypothetical protein
MLMIRPDIVEAVEQTSTPEGLFEHVQAAIDLEHATIPPYLTALLSIKTGNNAMASEIIGSVVGQEMLHMAIASNLLNALGGSPNMDRPGFIPTYPGPLPMGVGGSLTVHLAKLSRSLVYEVFMAIEEPEHPIPLKVKEPSVALLAAAGPPPRDVQARPSGKTIGDFYQAIADKIRQLGDGAFPEGARPRQVVDNTWFPADQLFPIVDVRTATAAIDVVVRQGEGTRTSPEEEGEPAHYYRFAQLVYARLLAADPSAEGWSFSGPAVGIDPAGVWNLLPNAKLADYPVGSRAYLLGDQVNRTYTNLLRSLQITFNGRPDRLKASLALMFEFNLVASELVATTIDGTSFHASPTFEYTPV